MPVVMRLMMIARGALRRARWFALAALVAGAIVLAGAWDVEDPGRSLVLAIVCIAPGLVLLHLVTLLASLPGRIRLDQGAGRAVLLGVGITYLLRPWYWMMVALSGLAAVVLLPLALLVVLGVV